jgi:endonuclease YncB( thermonuclease family)
MRTRFFATLCVVPVLLFSLSVLSVASYAQQSYPAQVTALRSANLRAGPGTNNAIVGGAQPGQQLKVSGCNSACDWYQVGDGQWIAAFLVEPVDSDSPAAPASPPAGRTAATVARIVDGDTLRVLVNGVEYPLRYIGMDTAEVGQPTADEATALNRSLVSGQTLYLEKDVSETDRYGRLLRYVWLADGRMVNEELVLDGCAVASTYPPDVKYQDRLRAAQQVAVAAGRTCGDASETAPAPTPVPSPTGATCTGRANPTGWRWDEFPTRGQLPGRTTTGDRGAQLCWRLAEAGKRFVDSWLPRQQCADRPGRGRVTASTRICGFRLS